MSSRAWMITVNDPDECNDIWPSFSEEPDADFIKWVRYVVWQYEQSPTTFRRHVQAYVEMNNACKMAKVKGLFKCPRMHVEKRVKTAEQCRDYCMKLETRDGPDGGPFEWGRWLPTGVTGGHKGGRMDLINACQVLKRSGAGQLRKERPDMWVKFHKGFQSLDYWTKLEETKDVLRDMQVWVIFGPPGMGKTFSMFSMVMESGKSFYSLPVPQKNQPVWFDGYQGEECLLIDEMSGRWMDWHLLMKILDRYPGQVPCKGGHLPMNWNSVILTSNENPRDWYPYNYSGGMDMRALTRRINKVIRAYTDPVLDENDINRYKFFEWKEEYNSLDISEIGVEFTSTTVNLTKEELINFWLRNSPLNILGVGRTSAPAEVQPLRPDIHPTLMVVDDEDEGSIEQGLRPLATYPPSPDATHVEINLDEDDTIDNTSEEF